MTQPLITKQVVAEITETLEKCKWSMLVTTRVHGVPRRDLDGFHCVAEIGFTVDSVEADEPKLDVALDENGHEGRVLRLEILPGTSRSIKRLWVSPKLFGHWICWFTYWDEDGRNRHCLEVNRVGRSRRIF